MFLSDPEFDRLEYLLGKHRLDKLSSDEEYEVKQFILKEYPSMQDSSFEEIVNTGLFIIGVRQLDKLINSYTGCGTILKTKVEWGERDDKLGEY